jgi:acetate kinase
MAVTLIVNPGSSSKKYALYVDKVLTLSAYVEKAENGGYVFCASVRGVDSLPGIPVSAAEYHESLDTFLSVAVEKKLLAEKVMVTTIALRIVAPGSYFQRHRVVDVEFVRELEAMIGSAPLHIPHVISELQAIQRLLPKVRTVAISDSAFHRTMPDMARQFSIPAETQGRYDLYRFGYHGLSVASVVRRLHAVTGEMPKRAIVCHIGSGVSVTALRSGLSIDTTMGYAPGSGLMMGTRAGDLDTGALLALMQARNLKPLDAQAFLQTQGGLRAIASEADLRLILDRRTKGDKEAILAVDTFVYQIQKAIGSYLVALGGIDQIIFTATASERSPILRSLICVPLEAIGVTLDTDKNEMCLGRDGVISTFTSPIKVVVMKADEAGEILALAEQVGVE